MRRARMITITVVASIALGCVLLFTTRPPQCFAVDAPTMCID